MEWICNNMNQQKKKKHKPHIKQTQTNIKHKTKHNTNTVRSWLPRSRWLTNGMDENEGSI